MKIKLFPSVITTSSRCK